MIKTRPLQLVAMAAVGALLVACASTGKKTEEPADLTQFASSQRVVREWQARVGSSAPKLRLGLALAVADDVVYAANHLGGVMAFDKHNGRRLWTRKTKLALTAGPGVGEGLVVVGSSHGKLVALDAATGEIKWNASINSELLSAPAIASGAVVFRAVDGRVIALNAADGTEMWSAEQQVPRLSLRGTSRPLIAGELVLAGFDNGRVQALQLRDGVTVWDINLMPPGGKTELERLNDIDTVMAVQGSDLYVVTYQGKVARIDIESGEVTWSRDQSSYSGLTIDDESVYVSTNDGSVVAITQAGIESWKNETLAWRRLSPPAVLGDVVAVADFDGYLHLLDRSTGALVARSHPFTERVSAAPVVSDGVLYMLDAAGNIAALRTEATAEGKGTYTPTGGETRATTAPLHPR